MEISGIWLISEEKDIVVLAQIDGKWYEVIRTFGPLGEMTISHHVNVREKLPSNVVEADWLDTHSGPSGT